MVNSKDACFIDGGRLRRGDSQRKTLRYEVIASRGCPFTCSYCSCAPLHRLMPPTVRTRSVESVMEELRAARAACFQEAGVPWVSYDFMLRHPFETIEDLKETYFLVKDLPGDYILQLHGLNFLPGTDIVPLAVEQGLFTGEELDEIMFAPMAQQFGAYWKQETSQESQLWYILTALWQWPQLRPVCLACETDPLAHRRDWRKKGDMVRRRFLPGRK